VNARGSEEIRKENCGISQKKRLFPGRLRPRMPIPQKLHGSRGTGEKNITIQMLERITKALKISLSELFKGV
jgi:hypothetical protein